MSYTIGGGGGPAGSTTSDDRILDKPYDIYWPLSQEQVEQINQMFELVFKGLRRTSDDVTTLEEAPTVSADLLTASYTLSNTEIQGLNTSPVTVVSAPGAGKWILPVSFAIEKKITVAYSAATTWNFRYGNGTDNLQGTAIAPLLNSTTDRWIGGTFSDNGAFTTTTDTDNQGIRLLGSADVTLGDAANQIKIKIAYYEVDSL